MNRTIFLVFLLLIVADASVDMITPALPDIRAFFSVSHTQVSLSVILDMFGFAVASIFYGYSADSYGRKSTAILGLSFFLIGVLVTCIGGLNPENFYIFILGRLIQGVGQGCAEVIIMSVIRDLYSGLKLDKYIALVEIVASIIPAIAPLLGSVFIKFFHWYGIFISLAYALVIIIVLFVFFAKETLIKRSPRSIKSFFEGYLNIFCNIKCMLFLTFIILAFFWIWNTVLNLPHVFIGNGVSASEYGICVLLYIVVYIFGSFCSPKIIQKFGRKNAIMISLIIIPISTIILLLITNKFSLHPYIIEILWGPEAFFLALLLNNLFAGMLRSVKEEESAKASALLSSFKSFASVGAYFGSYFASYFNNDTTLTPVLLWTLFCSLISLVLYLCVNKILFENTGEIQGV